MVTSINLSRGQAGGAGREDGDLICQEERVTEKKKYKRVAF